MLGRPPSGFRRVAVHKRVPPLLLWDLAAKKFAMADGRLAIADDFDNGFNTGRGMAHGLETFWVHRQSFPTAQFEMAGNPKENEVAGALHDRIDAVWPILKRVRVIPEYGQMFVDTFDNIDKAEEVTIAHIGGRWFALSSNSDRMILPDAFLAETTALTPTATRCRSVLRQGGLC